MGNRNLVQSYKTLYIGGIFHVAARSPTSRSCYALIFPSRTASDGYRILETVNPMNISTTEFFLLSAIQDLSESMSRRTESAECDIAGATPQLV